MPTSVPTVPYTIREQFHSQPTGAPLRIIHVGAGVSGLLTAYKAQRFLKSYELVCYEKNSGVGGTWLENIYPGICCDVPSHCYTLAFEPNPNWSGFYAYGDEIRRYFEGFYHKYELEPFMRFDTKVLEARWRDEKGEGIWEVTLEKKGGEKFTDWCHVLINGSGPLNNWKWPKIEGIQNYKGKICHSAAWDTSIDWTGKRVAVIGSGSTAVQVTPLVAKGSQSLTMFARNPTWIAPQMGSHDIRILLEDEKSSKPDAVGKHLYTEEEKEKLRTDPEAFLKYRKEIDTALQKIFPVFLRGTEQSKMAKKMMADSIRARIGPGHEDLKEKFIPKFSPGCRRLTPGEGFLECLTEDHVSVVSDEISKFTETGLITANGQSYDFDIIACCTGFDVAFAPHFKVTGVDELVLQEEWAEYPNIYLSVTSPNFPNYFTVGGPTGNWGQGCVLVSHEIQIEYALQCTAKLSHENLHSLTVKQGPTTDYLTHSDTWHRAKSVWAEPCQSWYKYTPTHTPTHTHTAQNTHTRSNEVSEQSGRVQLWCGSMLHLLKTLRVPRWEDYEIKRRDGNVFAFLGDGRIEREVLAEMGGGEEAGGEETGEEAGEEGGRDKEKGKGEKVEVDYSPYIRNEDSPWTLDV